jgi:hypothetical protein
MYPTKTMDELPWESVHEGCCNHGKRRRED